MVVNLIVGAVGVVVFVFLFCVVFEAIAAVVRATWRYHAETAAEQQEK